MSQTLLVLDCHYLCHRAFHSLGDLSSKGVATAVIYGFLRAIGDFKENFSTDRIAFCFEGERLRRKAIYPAYKAKRTQERSPEERAVLSDFSRQVRELRDELLPKIGFRNIFCAQGFESDDIMAAIAKNLPAEEEAYLITADSDMFQCLAPNVSIYSPQKGGLYTLHKFKSEFGIEPSSWAVYKALSGCATDNVAGIRGIGPVSALKFLRRELPEKHRIRQVILSREGKAIVRRNRSLVELPFKGCPVPELQPDRISVSAWKDVCARLGMRSIAGKPPVWRMKTHA